MKNTKFDKNVQILTYKPNTCLNSGEQGRIPTISLEQKSIMYFVDPLFRYNTTLRPVKVSTVYCAEKNHNFSQTNSTVYLTRQLPKSAW